MRPRSLLAPLLVVLPLAGCGGSSSGGDGPKPLVLSVDPFTVAAGQEVTYCQTIYADNAHMDFRHVSSRMVEGSHHLILYRDASSLVGQSPPPPGLSECTMETPRLYVYGAQEREHEVTLPEGIGGELEEDTIFILEVHFANASPQPVTAFAEVTIEPAPEGSVEQYSGILFYLNNDFQIPARAGFDGAPTYTEGVVCPVPESVNVYRTQSHTHKRGLRVDGWLADPEGTERQHIYKNEDWHAPVSREFAAPGLAVAAGQTIKFECTWENETDATIGFGPSVEDEMCILGLGYYPRIENGPLGLRGNVFCVDGQVYY